MNADGGGSPLFSVVIPVYDGEEFVGEAVDSVLAQTIGMDRLEVVVVDDGSRDGTAAIVDRFATLHPRHVTVIHKENGGVATALNAGVEAATGGIIGFLGADDRLSEDALEFVDQFFAEHGDECDLAAIPIHMFGARTGPHWNNRSRFDETRVIDVKEEWNLPQAHGGGTFIKAEVFRDWGLRFDPRLFISEDQTLNTQVILRKMRYGVIAGPRYFNRRYSVGGSLVSSSHFRREFYTDIPRHAYQRMLDAGRELHGNVPRYAQAMVAYDLSWRFRADRSVMDEDLEPEYRQILRSLLRQIDVDVIMLQRAPIEVRLSMLGVREGRPVREALDRRGLTYFFDETPVFSLEEKPRSRHQPARFVFEFFEVDGDSIEVQGTFRVPELEDWTFAMQVGDRVYPAERLADPRLQRRSYGNEVRASALVRASVELRAGERLTPVVLPAGGGQAAAPVQLWMHRFTRFSGQPDVFYYRRDGRTVFRQKGRFSIERADLTRLGVLRAELGFLRRALRAGALRSDLAMRLATQARRTFVRRQVWLIADHKSEAGDNGEAMFRYLCSNPSPDVEPCFVLRKDAAGYAELARLGKVLVPDSREHQRAYLDATVVMNSAADNYMLDPLGQRRTYLNDLVRHTSVFLQHGVIKHDLSTWLNRRAKGFDLVVTSAPAERDSIVHGNYGYRPDQVVLTGMPRYDRLQDGPDRLLVLAPTWRAALSGELDLETGRVGKSEQFARSDYFAFWQCVIQDPRLNEAMRDRGFMGVLALHPSHSAEVSTFEASDRIRIGQYPHDYADFFRRGNVLVTDYSSVAFDFAYLRKPVVYVQGDREEFFGSHLHSEGYFSYEDDGFGPVVTTMEGLVDSLLELLAHSCEMAPEYRERVDRFFAFSGGGNSERLRRVVEAHLGGSPGHTA